ncbi:MAG: hypothetical protein U0W65_14275 [Bacteroidia bacterium]
MKNLPFILFLLINFCAKAQDDYTGPAPRDYSKKPAKTAGFIELGGNAGLYSLNIDRIYYYKEKLKLSGRVGFAPYFNGFYIEQEYVVENNFIIFKNPHHLELGIGATLQRRYNERPNDPDNYFWENILFSVWRCGYRFQRQDDGFFFRAGLTPAIMSDDAEGFHSGYFQFWGGISLGVSF